MARWDEAKILRCPVLVSEEVPNATCIAPNATQQLLHWLVGTCTLV